MNRAPTAHVLAAALPFAFALALAGVADARAQEARASAGYPDRDILSPFRNPQEISAPPDQLFAKLREMRRIADAPGASRSYDKGGREVIDDPVWQQLHDDVLRLGIDAGMLAVLMRNSRNQDDRAVAFYAAFYCYDEEHVFNLLSHIPGEPERKTRELALPRAIEFVRTNIGRKFGDLSPDERQQLLRDMPQVGSPVANAQGIKRAPQDSDLLFTLNLKPFLQLLDLDDPLDQAQGLWFVKECCRIRVDLAQQWLEPSLPRLRQLLAGGDARVRDQAIGLLQAIGPKELAAPAADATPRQLDEFADRAIHRLFPPIRHLGAGLVLLFPSPERDAIAAAGLDALDGDRIGEKAKGKLADGTPWYGFRVDRVPEALAELGIPKGAVVRSINGTPVSDSRSLLATIRQQFVTRELPKNQPPQLRDLSRARIVVEFLVGDATHAIEYRVQ